MFVEMLVSSVIGFQSPLPASEPAQLPPPVATPTPAAPPAPVEPPLADAAGQVPPTPGVPASPPRGQPRRRSGTVPAAVATPPAPPGQQGLPAPAIAPGAWIPSAQGMYGAYGQSTGLLNGVYGYGLSRMAPDPKEAELDRKARELAGNIQREQDPRKKAELKVSLQQAVADQFQMRQQRRTEDLKRLEDEVKRLRDAMDKREKSRDAIIAKRIAELTGDDDLGF